MGAGVRVGDNVVLITGNEMGVLMLDYLSRNKKPASGLPPVAVKTIVSTNMADALCEKRGIELKNVLTGFKFICEQIHFLDEKGQTDRFLFGFEESYGFLSSTFVRDKDGVNASLLISEVACACMAEGITLYDRVQQIFREYGYYIEKVVSTTLPGKDGLTRMKEIMTGLRGNPPTEIGGLKVVAVRDYLRGVRTENGKEEPTGLPTSDVLYFELEKGCWVCVRPSGTEPKIKLYVNSNDRDQATAEEINRRLAEASKALMA
jgi:phosphoglucomutase